MNKSNNLLLSNFNIFPKSEIWKNSSSNYNLIFENIYDSNFSSLEKLDQKKINNVFILIYFNFFLSINHIKAIKFFTKFVRKKKILNFIFFF